ncbi:CbtA family protein [Hansschlegelia zhihuaiae]|uniref:Cobalt transporter n=1 Tax=Hansschlegelia zhihuaiae TaxID=405005 RepID=A0A4Q0MJJ7_9HYPH|nr:CbtA family protein [Hansschlegelia zhihuaiae]RXF73728.1 cobalt transporter [Hansschlegelia zhihuaiae]
MLNRILACGLSAGLLVGLFAAALQLTFVSPLILKAEVYEEAASAAHASAPAHEHAAGAVDHDHGEGWAPENGAERAAFTTLATVASTIGFALMLVAAAALSPAGLTVRTGVAFGLAGFAATGLAPSLGLAPELPGSAAGDLLLRQGWWIATAIATAAGIALLAYGRPALKALGVALMAAPHLIGAPVAGAPSSTAPAELSAAFAAQAIVVQAIVWTTLGAACGYVWSRQERSRTAARSKAPKSALAA